jgi:tRNA pseudouridine32 synthase/23S rRNA pseudouridine746 synthase
VPKLPTKNGVGPSSIALPPGPWATVLDFLVERFPHISRAEILARIDRGDVLNECGERIAAERVYTAREKLFYYRDIPDESRIPFDETILFRDEYLVAVDKPHFLPVSPVGRYVQETLLVRLKRTLGIDTLAPMHRLDRETAGVIIFTIQPLLRGKYQALFESRDVQKTYQAVALWRSDLQFPFTYKSRLVSARHFMKVEEVAGEANAETEIAVIEHNEKFARYQLTPRTGKKHQLRVQMAALGLPILYDQIYPHHVVADAQDLTRPLQLLAQSIAFRDPVTGQERLFSTQRRLLDLALCQQK